MHHLGQRRVRNSPSIGNINSMGLSAVQDLDGYALAVHKSDGHNTTAESSRNNREHAARRLDYLAQHKRGSDAISDRRRIAHRGARNRAGVAPSHRTKFSRKWARIVYPTEVAIAEVARVVRIRSSRARSIRRAVTNAWGVSMVSAEHVRLGAAVACSAVRTVFGPGLGRHRRLPGP